MLATRQGAVISCDEGHQFFGDEPAVFVCFAAAHLPIGHRSVFCETMIAGVGNANDDKRLDPACCDDSIGSLGHAPGASRNKRGARIEEVLTVVKIEHWEMPVRLLFVLWGDVNRDVAVV